MRSDNIQVQIENSCMQLLKRGFAPDEASQGHSAVLGRKCCDGATKQCQYSCSSCFIRPRNSLRPDRKQHQMLRIIGKTENRSHKHPGDKTKHRNHSNLILNKRSVHLQRALHIFGVLPPAQRWSVEVSLTFFRFLSSAFVQHAV